MGNVRISIATLNIRVSDLRQVSFYYIINIYGRFYENFIGGIILGIKPEDRIGNSWRGVITVNTAASIVNV